MTLSDSHFHKKSVIEKLASGCDMIGTYLNQMVGENQANTLGINCNKGRLYLTSNVSATLFREWSIEKIKAIINYLNDKADYEDFDLFKARNLSDLSLWAGYKSIQKKHIQHILYAIYVAHHNQQDSTDIMCSFAEIRSSIKQDFYERISAFCDACDEAFIPRCDYNGMLSATKEGNLLCLGCGQSVENVHCDVGHEVILNNFDNIVLFPTAPFLANVCETLKSAFYIIITGSFKIDGGTLILVPEKNGDIESFYQGVILYNL